MNIPLSTELNPFEGSIEKSALNFGINTSPIYMGRYFPTSDKDANQPWVPTIIHNKECKDKKAISKLDDDGNITDWWIVGEKYHVKTHKNFFHPIHQALIKTIEPRYLKDVKITTQSSRNGRWGLQTYVFPNVTIPIETKQGHNTDIQLRITTWSGLDGCTANNYIVGAFDGYCSNGLVFSRAIDTDAAYTRRYRRNTKGFNIDEFTADMKGAVDNFKVQSKEFQVYATTTLSYNAASKFIDSINSFSKSKREGMKALLDVEWYNRGPNIFSLHSALTRYSSDPDNPIIRTGKSKHKDSKHELLHKREEEVTTILQSNSWKELVAAHV